MNTDSGYHAETPEWDAGFRRGYMIATRNIEGGVNLGDEIAQSEEDLRDLVSTERCVFDNGYSAGFRAAIEHFKDRVNA